MLLPGECPSGWQITSIGTCVKIFSSGSGKNFYDASWKCNTLGGELARVLTQADQDLIYTMVNSTAVKAWIGLIANDMQGASSGGWVWKDWTQLSYTNWDSSTNGTDICGTMRGSSGLWRHNNDCNTTTISYVCEKRRKGNLPN